MEKYSTGLRNFVASGGSWRKALQNGRLRIYSGTQPTDADQAVQGTMLCEITQDGGTPYDDELRSAGSVTLSTWTADSITSITAATVEILGTTITFAAYGTKALAAAAIALAINKYNPLGITAVVDGDGSAGKVILHAPLGVSPVTWAVATTESGPGAVGTDVNFNTEVVGDAPANGLQYGLYSAGTLPSYGTWSGTVTTAGTAGWFRFTGSLDDTGALSTTHVRIDGTITSTGGGGDMTLTSTTLALNAPITISSYVLTINATGT